MLKETLPDREAWRCSTPFALSRYPTLLSPELLLVLLSSHYPN